jgi:hypothetical protein
MQVLITPPPIPTGLQDSSRTPPVFQQFVRKQLDQVVVLRHVRHLWSVVMPGHRRLWVLVL